MPHTDAPVRALVVGVGSIGRRHLGNLRKLGVTDLLVHDPSSDALESARRDFGAVPYKTLDEALSAPPDAVLVCTPPTTHVQIARQAVARGCHVFVEKPLSNSMDGVQELLAEADATGVLLFPGFNLRFHEGLLKLKELLDDGVIGRPLGARFEYGYYLPYWRAVPDYRVNYTARSDLGGGIILDASHELDAARWLFGEFASIHCVAGRYGDLEMDVEDTAAMLITTTGGLCLEVHVDCLQRQYTRTVKVIGTAGTLWWDHLQGVVHTTSEDLRPGSNVEKEAHSYPVRPGFDPMYVDQLRCFLACIAGEAQPPVSGQDAKRLLEIALAAHRSARSGKTIDLTTGDRPT